MPDPRMPFRRLQRSLKRHGAVATVRHIGTLPFRRHRHEDSLSDFVKEQDGTFDVDFNVDTGGFIKINDLKTVGRHRADAVDYQATSPSLFREMISKLDIDFPSYTFIDVGSGKGRAVLLAAAYPFRRIIGVEFAPQLCDTARRNLITYTGQLLCEDIEIVCEDVDGYSLPAGPAVFFIYNTFAATMMKRFANKVLRHSDDAEQPSCILYCSPEHADVYQDGRFTPIALDEGYRVYRVEPRAIAANRPS